MKRLLFAFALLMPLSAAAQTTVLDDKHIVVWDPSPDNDSVVDGKSMVTKYIGQIFERGAVNSTTLLPTGPPLYEIDLGKPAVTPEGMRGPVLKTIVSSNREYYIYVIAMGERGQSGFSPAAGPFGWPAPPARVPGVRLFRLP